MFSKILSAGILQTAPDGYRYLNRGHNRILVLIPGWAFDAKIFEPLDLDFDYLVPRKIDIARFNADLADALFQKKIKEVSLLGWSMGGFLAVGFLKEYGEAVRDIFLVSMRRSYSRQEIRSESTELKKDPTAYLTAFYRNCFMGQTHAFRWFKKHLFRSYIENFDLGSLLRGLDYLMQQELEPALLKRDNTHIIHGKKDRIAPLSEILEFLGAPPFPPVSIIEKTGHLPFLEPGFKEGIKRL